MLNSRVSISFAADEIHDVAERAKVNRNIHAYLSPMTATRTVLLPFPQLPSSLSWFYLLKAWQKCLLLNLGWFRNNNITVGWSCQILQMLDSYLPHFTIFWIIFPALKKNKQHVLCLIICFGALETGLKQLLFITIDCLWSIKTTGARSKLSAVSLKMQNFQVLLPYSWGKLLFPFTLPQFEFWCMLNFWLKMLKCLIECNNSARRSKLAVTLNKDFMSIWILWLSGDWSHWVLEGRRAPEA